MSRRLRLVLLLNVLVTVVLAVGLAVVLLREEPRAAQEGLAAAAREQLEGVRAQLSMELTSLEQGLLARLDRTPPDKESLRELVRTTPLVRQAFAATARGELLHPFPGSPLTAGERQFLERAGSLWNGRGLLVVTPGDNAGEAAPPVGWLAPGDQGWLVRPVEDGLQLLLWRRVPAGHLAGVEVDRVALLARLVGRLPAAGEDLHLALVDALGQPVARWGAPGEPPSSGPEVSVPLAPPLEAWKLTARPSARQAALLEEMSRLQRLRAGATAGGVSLLLVLLAVLLGLGMSRALREAAQRVNFVTQVSHELKTPLTNIQLYAELLGQDLPEEDQESARKLGVIVSETQRLGRLIHNLLTFSRQQRGALPVRRVPTDLDALVQRVVSQFAPRLAQQGLEVHVHAGAPEAVLLDPDLVGQVLANLVSNVEKYAAAGKWLELHTEQDARETRLRVADRGPGIPVQFRERVFQPFFRVSNRLTDGVTGTGIGLTISRDLARLLGGDLVLLPDGPGSTFLLRLPRTEVDHAVHEGAGGGG